MVTKIQDPVLMPCFEDVWGQSKPHKCKTLTPVQAYTGAQLEEAALNGTWTVSWTSLKIDLYWSDTIQHDFCCLQKKNFCSYNMQWVLL